VKLKRDGDRRETLQLRGGPGTKDKPPAGQWRKEKMLKGDCGGIKKNLWESPLRDW